MKQYDIIFSVTNDLNQDVRMDRICSSLQFAGYQVLLIGREKSSSTPLIKRSFDQERIKCSYESGKAFYIDYNYRLYNFLKKQKTKVYSAVDLDTIIPNYHAAKSNYALISFDAHEYFEEVPEVYNRRFVKSIWRRIGLKYVPKVNLAYTVGNELAKLFTDKYSIDFSVIKNVPLKSKDELHPKKNGKIIIYQGMINKGRGVLEMIKAMSELPEWEFWIVGNGDLYGAAQRLAKNSTASDRIKFHGFLPKKEIIPLTKQATIGLNLVSNEGLSYYYSLANKCFDYIQSGLPSINLNYPEYASLNREHHVFYLIDSLTSDELVKTIQRIGDDQLGYQRRIENNIKAAKVLNWENEEQKLISLYERLLADK